jgi:hypothetical protein
MILSRFIIGILILSSISCLAYSCTISFQNISTHGKTDLEDSQTPTNETQATATIPAL